MNRRRIRLAKHPIEHQVLRLVFIAMIAPTLLAAGCLYYTIWQTVAYQLAIPELIAESLMPAFHQVNRTLLISLPILFALILWLAAKVAHRIAGPLERLENDLDEMIKSKNHSKPLRVRRTDALWHLVEKINQLLKQIHKPRH